MSWALFLATNWARMALKIALRSLVGRLAFVGWLDIPEQLIRQRAGLRRKLDFAVLFLELTSRTPVCGP